ncbi:MAG: NADH-quinone oxidoreductase subunit J [Pseudomonadota bacterium]
MEPILFWLFALLAVLGASLVILLSNPVRGAMCLVGTLFCIAVLFVLLDAHLLAALEVLVYAGAVMVLFLFVIMLLNLREEELGARRFTLVKVLSFASTVGVGYMLGGVVGGDKPRANLGASYGTVEAIGRLLLKDYLLAFELTSILLLMAVVGAVLLAKRRI